MNSDDPKSFYDQLEIDPMRLDTELAEHPGMVMGVGYTLADVRHKYDEAKHQLEIVKAEIGAQLRDSGVKVTEAYITSETLRFEAVLEAQRQFNAAREQLGVWEAVMEATRAKGFSLKTIADLTIAGFIAPDAAYAQRKAEINEKRKAS